MEYVKADDVKKIAEDIRPDKRDYFNIGMAESMLLDCKKEISDKLLTINSIDEDDIKEHIRCAKCDIKIHHYFEDEDFGDLYFYATLHCSNCSKNLGEISLLDHIPNPCESYDDDWEINPIDFYAVEREKAEEKLKKWKLDNYCPECGCRLKKEIIR